MNQVRHTTVFLLIAAIFVAPILIAEEQSAGKGSHASKAPSERVWIGLGYLLRTAADGTQFLYVHQVAPGGPSAKAGISAGDLILRLNDKPIQFGDEVAVRDHFAGLRAGTRVSVIFVRAGAKKRAEAIVSRVPEEFEPMLTEAERRDREVKKRRTETRKQ